MKIRKWHVGIFMPKGNAVFQKKTYLLRWNAKRTMDWCNTSNDPFAILGRNLGTGKWFIIKATPEIIDKLKEHKDEAVAATEPV